MKKRLTPPQRKALAEMASSPEGRVECIWPRGYARSNWEWVRMRLCSLGLAQKYRHGGYEITDAGRAELGAA